MKPLLNKYKIKHVFALSMGFMFYLFNGFAQGPGDFSQFTENKGDLLINELMPSNLTTICDEDGDYEDWIEIHNNSAVCVNLENYKITDDEQQPNKWVFPSIAIDPYGFLIIFASGKDRLEGPYLHTNFCINAAGEPTILIDPMGNIVDYLNAGDIGHDISFGRLSDGSNQFEYFYLASPGSTNANNIVLNTFEISHDGGFYTDPFTLTFAPDNPDATIYFTLDGSEPHPDSAGTFLYTNGIEIIDASVLPNNISMIPTTPGTNGNLPAWSAPAENIYKATVVRARAYSNNHPSCKTYTNTYMVNPEIFEKFTMPVFSIVTDSLNLFAYDSGIYVPGQFYDSTVIKSGNYYQTGDAWEKNIHLEYYSADGEILLDQDAGVRMHGNLSLTAPQKALKFYARDSYGNDHFPYALFADLPFEEYKRFILRSSFSAHVFAIITDALIHAIVKPLNIDRMAVQPALVLINGEYWGIQTMREKQDKFYLEQHHGANPDSVDILSAWGIVLEGNAGAYSQLYNFVNNNDLTIPANYDFVKTQIDVESYIDYYIAETYFGNRDWPGNNFKFWRPQTDDGKWRYLLYDLDAAFRPVEFNGLVQASTDTNSTGHSPYWATLIFRKMLQNESFQQEFIGRYEELVNTVFSADSVINKIDEFEEVYVQELDQHIGRWNWPTSIDNWQQTIENMRLFAQERPCVIKEQLEEFFGIDSVNIVCVTGFGFNNPDVKEKILIYPNPAKTRSVWLKTISGAPILEYSFFDLTGMKVLAQHIHWQEVNMQVEVDISALKAGIYIVRVRDYNNVSFTKLIVN